MRNLALAAIFYASAKYGTYLILERRPEAAATVGLNGGDCVSDDLFEADGALMHFRKREINKQWNQIIGSRIMQLRESAGLTQHQLATLAKLSDKGTISRYESGQTIPSAHTLYRISRILNCSLDSFYEQIRLTE